MESKLDDLHEHHLGLATSNRTSMESKLLPGLRVARLSLLLIEPVWNRNKTVERAKRAIEVLLIEPVWNRNEAETIGTNKLFFF